MSVEAVFKAPPEPEQDVSSSTGADIETKVISKKTKFNPKNSKPISKECDGKTLLDVIYKIPEWSGKPPTDCGFNIWKEGVIVNKVVLHKPVTLFGRQESCDVVLAHPSSSRRHAVVQYCKGNEKHCAGFYLFDLESQNGTYLNKTLVKPKVFYKVEVGNFLKFACSSRRYILFGPPKEEVCKDVEPKEKLEEKEETTCNWGMMEDAVEEEDMAENPFALSTPNEDLYIDDPKKTLRGWFEREGYDLEYNVEEKGFKNFMCTVELPIKNPLGSGNYIAEATVSGKKKEAVVACAMEACRMLDRCGMLRQTHHESRQRKQKNWEENDFYDSDEDIYFDRTGTIEKKREKRKSEKSNKAETYESLTVKLQEVSQEIKEIEQKLASTEDSSKSTPIDVSSSTEDDPLDQYMTMMLSSKERQSSSTRKQLKLRLLHLQQEQHKLTRWCSLTKNCPMPELTDSNVQTKSNQDENPMTMADSTVHRKITTPKTMDIGTKNMPNKRKSISVALSSSKLMTDYNKDFVSHVQMVPQLVSRDGIGQAKDSSEQPITKDNTTVLKETITTPETMKLEQDNSNIVKAKVTSIKPVTNVQKDDKSIDPVDNKELKNKIDCEKDCPSKKKFKRDTKETDEERTDENYSMWLPPTNAIGNATWKSSLNSKFGY